jgi:hypothetical protein
MFMPWFARFFKLHLFSRGLQNPLMHPLCGAMQSNTSKWFSKGSHSRQWLVIRRMIKEEGPLFARKVQSLVIEGWKTHAIHTYETLFSSNEW